jgi:PKD repeat protein
MKRLTYLFLTLTFILFSCHKTPNPPTASFSVDITNPEVGQTVYFNNNSQNGDKFDWDFGDGTISTEINPAHVFTATGGYDVTLTVTSKNGSTDKSSLTINVLVPTLLEIEVREWTADGNGNVVPDASVLLYPTLTDWNNQTHSVSEAFTDADGIAVFSNLDPFVYYVDVWEATHDNYQLASEDVGFIRTPQVLTHKITGFIAYVDVVTHTSGVSRNRNMVIKSIGRKAIDKNLIPGFSGSWEDLLNRRSVKVK